MAAVIECEAKPFIKVIGARRAQTRRIVAERNVVKFSVGICPRITGKNLTLGSRLLLRTGRGSTWGPILLGIYGLTFIVTGIFVTDPVLGYPPGVSSTPTVYGTLHNLFGQLQFISLSVACFMLARRDAADPARRGWAWYSLATGLLVAVLFVLTSVVVVKGGPAGLVQRIFIIVGWGWIAVLAIRLMSKKAPLA